MLSNEFLINETKLMMLTSYQDASELANAGCVRWSVLIFIHTSVCTIIHIVKVVNQFEGILWNVDYEVSFL